MRKLVSIQLSPRLHIDKEILKLYYLADESNYYRRYDIKWFFFVIYSSKILIWTWLKYFVANCKITVEEIEIGQQKRRGGRFISKGKNPVFTEFHWYSLLSLIFIIFIFFIGCQLLIFSLVAFPLYIFPLDLPSSGFKLTQIWA